MKHCHISDNNVTAHVNVILLYNRTLFNEYVYMNEFYKKGSLTNIHVHFISFFMKN